MSAEGLNRVRANLSVFESNILIVDDDVDQVRILRRLLIMAGYFNIKSAQNPIRALKYIDLVSVSKKKKEQLPDIILLDYNMKEMTGLQVTEQLREKFPDICIIMITAKDDPDLLINAYHAGVIDYMRKPVRQVELMMRMRSASSIKIRLNELKKRETDLMSEKESLAQANEFLFQSAETDGLTGIANRRHFDATLSQEFKRGCRDETVLGLILMDVDYFKKYNDTYGHQAGDDCLVAVAAALRTCVREVDTAARYGGEEFVLIAPGAGPEKLPEIMQRIKETIIGLQIKHESSDVAEYLTISMGATYVVPTEGFEPEEMTKRADEALYLSKENGRNMGTVLPFIPETTSAIT